MINTIRGLNFHAKLYKAKFKHIILCQQRDQKVKEDEDVQEVKEGQKIRKVEKVSIVKTEKNHLSIIHKAVFML